MSYSLPCRLLLVAVLLPPCPLSRREVAEVVVAAAVALVDLPEEGQRAAPQAVEPRGGGCSECRFGGCGHGGSQWRDWTGQRRRPQQLG
jgi:hypothetical protein